jgi:RES domain-containing protein
LPESAIFDAIEAIGSRSFSGELYRHVAVSRDCLSGEGARAFGGRWNPPHSFPTIYTSLTASGAAAELRRLADVQNRRPAEFLPRKVCRLDAALSRIVDLSNPRALRRIGLAKGPGLADDVPASQMVGRVVHQLGFEGILTLSVAGPFTNLVIFELNLEPSSKLRQLDSLIWDDASRLP